MGSTRREARRTSSRSRSMGGRRPNGPGRDVNTSQDCWTDFHVCITDDKADKDTFKFASMFAGFRDATITVGGKERNMKFEEKEGSHKEGKDTTNAPISSSTA